MPLRWLASMKNDRIIERWRLICGEIQHRWPSLPVSELNRTGMPEELAVELSRHYDFSYPRAKTEADYFWADLEERLQRAA